MSGSAGARRGIQRERQVREILETEGWWVVRAAGSFGDADLVALRSCDLPPLPGLTDGRWAEARLIEVKSTHRGPFHGFPPAARVALLVAAQKAGAQAWLAFWPPRGELSWIHSNHWPLTDGTSRRAWSALGP